MSQDRISDQLREMLAKEPGSLHTIAKAAGVPASVLSRFAGGVRGLNLESVDKLAKSLGIRLVQTRRRPKRV